MERQRDRSHILSCLVRSIVSQFDALLTPDNSCLRCRNRHSSLSPLTPFLPLPKYFDSEWSYAQYRIPTQAAHISLSTTSIRSPQTDLAADEKCVVGWITIDPDDSGAPSEFQLVVLTYSGGWYRLALPSNGTQPTQATAGTPPRSPTASRQRTSSISSVTSLSTERGKGKEREKDKKGSRELVLQEYRKYGRWDGWG